MPRFLSIILKVLFGLLLLLVLAVVGALVALRVPSVQTNLAQRAALLLTEKLGQKVLVNRVDVRPFSRVLLEGVRVLDKRGNELFNIGRADADIKLFSIFDPSHLHIGRLTLEEPRFHLVTYKNQPDSTTLDQFISSVKRLLGPSDTTKTGGKPFDFQIEALSLRNGQFVLERQNVPRIPEYGRTMDYAHMQLDSIYADADQLWFRGDSIHANVQGLRTVDTPSGTRLRELTANMTYASKFWEFDKLMLRVGRSKIHDYLRFEYKRFLNFTSFNDSVKIIARLEPSRLYSDDIAQFAPDPAVRDLKETVLISGQAKGYVRNFTTKDLDITYGQGTRVRGDINVEGLPNFKESFIVMRLQPSVLRGTDLRRYIPANGWPYVRRLGTVKLKGQFLGFYNDFVANGSFQTALGSLTSDVNIKLKNNPRYSSYEGKIRTSGFQLGKLLGDESLVRDVAFNGRVEGVGFEANSLRLTANANVQSIWLNGYRYRNITTNGVFSRRSFTGKIAANDPNLKFDADGTINLRPREQAFDLRARVQKADLRALGLTNESITIATTADVKFEGLRLDALLGYARLRNSTVGYAGRTVAIDTLDVLSQLEAGERRVRVRSEVLNLSLVGDFTPSTVIRDVKTLVAEYKLNFASNDVATADYYRRKRQQPLPDYHIDLNLYLKQPNPTLHLFLPQLTIADSTRFDGSFRNGQTSILQLGGNIASLRYDSVQVFNADVDLTTSKLPYQPEILAQASVTSERQRLPGLGATENFYVEGVWDQEKINFSTSLAQTNTTNKAQINGALVFLEDAVKIIFRQSGVNLLGKNWTIAPDNSLIISGGGREFDFQNVTLSNGEQSVSAQGFLSENPDKPLALTVTNFELATLNGLTGSQKFGGRVNALGTISGVFGPLVINSTLKVDSLTLDQTLIGNVQGRGDWDNALGRLNVNLDVARDARRVLAVTGYIAPGSDTQQLNLSGVLEQTPIKLAEPFLNTLFKDVSGTGVGTLRVGGLFAAPVLTGNIDVTDGQLTFIYLGTTYTFADRIRFLEDRIALQNITVRDPQGNTGIINGNIYERGFQDTRLDLSASFRKLQVLNTTRRDNEQYFGQAYATGTAVVRGPADNLSINVTARSEAGTRMSLPFDNAAKAEQASYIKFVNRNLSDSARAVLAARNPTAQTTGKVDLSGLRLNMNLDITPDAYLELLLDESTGDIMRGTATGQLRLNIDTRGDFNMYGQVELVRGAYNFTLQGLVNKEFVVRPGGTVAWNGDPLAGELNVTATYTQRTSLAPVLYQTGSSNPNTSLVPVTAVMNLTGPLLQPIIKLNLEFNDIPSSLEGDLAPFLSAIRNDEQELNRQVFSLVVFRQLTPPGSLAVTRLEGGNNALGNSLGQILSTQLGLLTSQIDPNLEISFNINGLSADDLAALQLRLSYSFLNGRLRITRDGSFGSNSTTGAGPGGVATSSAQTSVIGDLSLEYYLRPDGKFRAKLRYETTPRDFTGLGQGVNQARAGISLLHTEQFDTFRELFARKRLSRRDRDARKARELQVDNDPRTEI